ncbi:MAG TPA: toprim domain-containing protein [Candidatus Nanoarchaeia archaeon]|nr:toprim domain-containing protein [Candidatus Nanoarchaeia archaeon]
MNPFNRLVEMFSEFPGIGPRQAKRFVYFLLTKPNGFNKDLTRLIEELKQNTLTCTSCYRIFTKTASESALCNICSSKNRDRSILAVVARDSDLESLEKSGSFNGLYFVLGGIVPILEADPEKKIRSRELIRTIESRFPSELKEVILALSANADSENTGDYIVKLLSSFKDQGLKITLLGRGLSTGTELEYSDAETLKNALSNRK